MYVIFPADELILLTYGAAIPRLQPRPTLDNLREPLVPIGTRPPISVLNDTHHNHNTLSQNKSSTNNLLNSSNTTNTTNQTNENNSSKRNSIINSNNSNNSSNHITTSVRDRSPSVTFAQEDQIHDYEIDDDQLLSCERIPSYFLETTPPNTNPVSSTTSTSATAKAKKPKSRLHISLGRLRPHSHEQAETARIREDLEIHVTNPTFTRDNLRQRNFDAFFESGEINYSLERKEKVQTPEEIPDTLTTPSSAGTPSTTENSKINSLGFFRKNKNPINTRPKSAEYNLTAVEESQKGDRCPHLKICFSFSFFYKSVFFFLSYFYK